MKRIKIGTRIHLNYIEFSKSKNDRIAVYFRDNLSGENASANAMLFPVLLNGSAKYPDMVALSEKLQDLYGANMFSRNVIGELSHIVGATISFLGSRFTLNGEDNLSDCIKLLAEVILNPALENGVFRKDYVETERINLINDIRAEINDKAVYAKNKCIELMCGDDEYKTSSMGTEEGARKITAQSLYENYQRLLRSSHIEIFYAGTESAERVVETVKLHFTFPKGEAQTLKIPHVLPKADEPCEVVETMDVAQGKLAMGFTTNIGSRDPEIFALSLFFAIYGVIPTSKLSMNVREKLSLCYYCSCRGYNTKGIMLVSSGIETENKDKATSEILHQLSLMKEGGFTDEELEIARESLTSVLRAQADGSADLISWWLVRICNENLYSPEEAIEKYNAVTREDIIRAGRDIELSKVFFLASSGKEA